MQELRQVNNCITMGSPLRRYVDVIISRIPRAKWEDTRRNRTTASGASVSEKSLVRLHKQVRTMPQRPIDMWRKRNV